MSLPPFHWWRTVFWLIPAISVYTIVLGAVSLASSLVDRRGNAAHWCARTWSWLILATTGVRVHASGLERIRRDRVYLFVSNHQSIYDTPILWATLPYQLRIIAKASLGRFPVLGWHLRYTGHLLVGRARPGKAILSPCRRTDRAGALAERLCGRHAFVRRSCRPVQAGPLSDGRRSRSAGRAGRRDREPPRDAEGAPDDLPGRGRGRCS